MHRQKKQKDVDEYYPSRGRVSISPPNIYENEKGNTPGKGKGKSLNLDRILKAQREIKG